MRSIKVTPNFFALYFAGKGLRPIPKNLFIGSHIIGLKCMLVRHFIILLSMLKKYEQTYSRYLKK